MLHLTLEGHRHIGLSRRFEFAIYDRERNSSRLIVEILRCAQNDKKSGHWEKSKSLQFTVYGKKIFYES
jgi:hypothetical protein